MISVDDATFNNLVAEGIDAIGEKYQPYLKNVVFVVEPEPNPLQRKELGLKNHENLFGLYEGVPLPARNNPLSVMPDKITIFKQPLEQACNDIHELAEMVRSTVWHEVAHYFGLDHTRIYELQRNK